MKISNAWIDKSQTGPKSKEGHGVGSSQNIMEYQQQKQQWKRSQRTKPSSSSSSHINNLDDGCLMHIFNFLPPIPGMTPFFSLSLSYLFFALQFFSLKSQSFCLIQPYPDVCFV